MKVRPNRSPIKWPDGARIAITPCVAFETWPEDLGGPKTLQQEFKRAFSRPVLQSRIFPISSGRSPLRDMRSVPKPGFMTIVT